METLCIVFTVLSILTTFVYFFLSDHKNKITKPDRTFTKKRKEPDLVTFEEVDELMKKEPATEVTEEEERMIQRQQLEQIYSLMEKNTDLSTSLEALQEQLKLYH